MEALLAYCTAMAYHLGSYHQGYFNPVALVGEAAIVYSLHDFDGTINGQAYCVREGGIMSFTVEDTSGVVWTIHLQQLPEEEPQHVRQHI